MTTGRVAGIGVLAGAVLLLAVIAGRAPRTTPGVPVAAPVLPAPTVGQCLVDRAGSEPLLADDQGVRSPHRDLRDCPVVDDGASSAPVVVGEVAGILADHGGRPHDDCAAPVAHFLGGPAPAVEEVWASAGGPTVVIVDPDRRQWADGQRWLACVVVPPMWTGAAPLDPTRGLGPVLRESARGRWSDPTYRDRLGDCFDEYSGAVGRLLSLVYCGSPHEIERIGLVSAGIDPRAAAMLRQSCSEWAAVRIASTDPTRGGQLRLEVDVTAPGGTSREVKDDEEALPEGASADCVVRPADPNMLLTATVVGLGDAPVPLTPR